MHIYQTANPALSQLCWVSSWEQTVSYVKLGVKSCWILWLEHTFFKDKTGIKLLYHWEWNTFLNYSVLTRNQSHYPFPPFFPTLWNLKIGIVSQMVCTSSLPKSHNIYGMTWIWNLMALACEEPKCSICRICCTFMQERRDSTLHL